MPAEIHGRLASQDMAVNGYSSGASFVLYAVPAGRKATVSIRVCNRSGASVSSLVLLVAARTTNIVADSTALNAAISNGAIEHGPSIPAAGVLESTGITLSAGQAIHSAAPTLSALGPAVTMSVFGIEEDA